MPPQMAYDAITPPVTNPWWRTARIYLVPLHTYADGNGDGWGDIPGLIGRLDDIADMGFDWIWLLPVYPSPREDNWFDTTDFFAIDIRFGSVADYQRLTEEAHTRGIRVIQDVPYGHTSDQHPWFQAGSDTEHPEHEVFREFYLWSDNPHEWDATPVIFKDTETSNAQWCERMGLYYCHRFKASQPMLNHDNPLVQEKVKEIFEFQYETLGVDVVRWDAVPHVLMRPGRLSESLPETFAYVRGWCDWVHATYPGRGILAEACQESPILYRYHTDAHVDMTFDFDGQLALWRLVTERRAGPIERLIDTYKRLPLSAGMTRVVFHDLHDEHTAEFAGVVNRYKLQRDLSLGDPRRVMNWGTVGRTMALLEGNVDRWRLLNAMMYALPGGKLTMAGDELGQGDDMSVQMIGPGELTPDARLAIRTIYPERGDDERAGFSDADPAMFCATLVDDPVLGYRAVNAAAQRAHKFSQRAFIRGLNHLTGHYAFRHLFYDGAIDHVEHHNPALPMWIRRAPGRSADDVLLVVGNPTATEQEDDIDLSPWKGRVRSAIHPIILGGDPSEQKEISDEPFHITLEPYGFRYYVLDRI